MPLFTFSYKQWFFQQIFLFFFKTQKNEIIKKSVFPSLNLTNFSNFLEFIFQNLDIKIFKKERKEGIISYLKNPPMTLIEVPKYFIRVHSSTQVLECVNVKLLNK